jgi:hypothetical protein
MMTQMSMTSYKLLVWIFSMQSCHVKKEQVMVMRIERRNKNDVML